jgi:hypothetical protein
VGSKPVDRPLPEAAAMDRKTAHQQIDHGIEIRLGDLSATYRAGSYRTWWVLGQVWDSCLGSGAQITNASQDARGSMQHDSKFGTFTNLGSHNHAMAFVHSAGKKSKQRRVVSDNGVSCSANPLRSQSATSATTSVKLTVA